MDGLLFLLTVPFGLLLPGFFLGRLLGARDPLVSGFVLSVALLFQTVFWYQVFAVPIRFGSVFAALATVTGIAAGLWWRQQRRRAAAIPEAMSVSRRPWPWWVCGAVGVVALGLFLFRLVLVPIHGPDTFIRWDFLARRLLEFGHLSYYPPCAAPDFGVYFLAEAIPPLVSATYFWTYAALGQPLAAVTAVPVMLQAACLLWLCYKLAEAEFGASAGLLAVGALVSSERFTWGVAMGQETGYTALALAATLYFIATSRPRRATAAAVLAGAATAIGALAREYGWAFLVCGMLLIWWRRLGWRYLVLYAATALVLALPWYVRTWVLTGNPFYSLPVGNLFPVNRVYADILRAYAERMSLSRQSGAQLALLATQALRYSVLPLTAGLLAAVWYARRHGWLLACAAVTAGVWAYSVQYTAGPYYSMRVLTPTLFVLAVTAGGGLAAVARAWPPGRWALLVSVGLLAAWGALYAALYPAMPGFTPWRDWPACFLREHSNIPADPLLREAVVGKLPRDFRVLTDDAYAGVELADTGVRAVPVWSPEVAFLFDDHLPPVEVRRRLLARKIRAVLYYPNSVNTSYLERHAFYAQDRQNWAVLAQTPGWVLYDLAVSPPTPGP